MRKSKAMERIFDDVLRLKPDVLFGIICDFFLQDTGDVDFPVTIRMSGELWSCFFVPQKKEAASGKVEIQIEGHLTNKTPGPIPAAPYQSEFGFVWVTPLADYGSKVEIDVKRYDELLESVFKPLVIHILRTQPDGETLIAKWVQNRSESAVQTEKMDRQQSDSLQAHTFKKLKDDHPGWTRRKLAEEAVEQLGNSRITEETVRNAYRKMNWKWERGERIR